MKVKNVLFSLIPVLASSIFFQIVYSIEGYKGFILFAYFKEDIIVGIAIIVFAILITIIFYIMISEVDNMHDTLRDFTKIANRSKKK